jgi:hypothetical protein
MDWATTYITQIIENIATSISLVEENQFSIFQFGLEPKNRYAIVCKSTISLPPMTLF